MSFPHNPNPLMPPGADPPPVWLILMATVGFFLAVMIQGCL